MKTTKPKKIKFSKKKAALHKMVEALINEDMEAAAKELQAYLQLKSRELLGEEAEDDEDEDKEDEKEEKSEKDEDDEDEDKEKVEESLAGFYGVETKTGNFHVKADSKEHARKQALSKVKKETDIKNIYFDKTKTKMSAPRKKTVH